MRHLLVLLLLPACFNPDDIFILHGSVTSPEPVRGLTVRLLRGAPARDEPTCSAGTPFKETLTDGAGSWSFEVFRAQAQKLSGFGWFCFRAQTAFASGSEAFSDIQGLNSEQAVTAFPDWRAQPSRVDGVLRFEPVVPLPLDETAVGAPSVTHRADWLTSDGGLAWEADDRVGAVAFGPEAWSPIRQPVLLDDFVLEDFSGSLSLSARVWEGARTSGPGPLGSNSAAGIEARSGQTLALAGTKVPISRGLACPAVGSPCPLTDGDLTTVDAGVQTLTLTLPMAAPLSAVVLRGVETVAPVILISLRQADGGAAGVPTQLLLPSSMWGAPIRLVERPLRDGGRELSVAPEPTFAVVPLDAGVPIGSVTLSFPGGLMRAAEVSLFE